MKYLFQALFHDGSIIKQTLEDKSSHTENKNAFFDVLQRFSELRAFMLINQETGDEHVVDLADGHFEINGTPIFLHNEIIQELKLVFFKRNTISLVTHEAYPVGYNFGFEAKTLGGQKIERLMTLY